MVDSYYLATSVAPFTVQVKGHGWCSHGQKYHILTSSCISFIMPPPRRGAGAGGIKRSSASVCLMSRTSALTRKPKGLGRRNFAQGYPRSHATPTPTSRSKGQKSRSAGAGAYCGGHLAAQLVIEARLTTCPASGCVMTLTITLTFKIDKVWNFSRVPDNHLYSDLKSQRNCQGHDRVTSSLVLVSAPYAKTHSVTICYWLVSKYVSSPFISVDCLECLSKSEWLHRDAVARSTVDALMSNLTKPQNHFLVHA